METASSIGIGAHCSSQRRSLITITSWPSSTAISAAAQRSSRADLSPSGPSAAAKRACSVVRANVPIGVLRSAAISSSTTSGLVRCTSRAASGVVSSSEWRRPSSVSRDITISSRIESIAGFVTWANFCLK